MSQCRYCGAQGLLWKDLGGLWRLFDADGQRHGCQGKPARAPEVVRGKLITGANYRPVVHAASCKALPWDSCPCPPPYEA